MATPYSYPQSSLMVIDFLHTSAEAIVLVTPWKRYGLCQNVRFVRMQMVRLLREYLIPTNRPYRLVGNFAFSFSYFY